MRSLICTCAVILGMANLQANAQQPNAETPDVWECAPFTETTNFCKGPSEWLIDGEVRHADQGVSAGLKHGSNRYQGEFGIFTDNSFESPSLKGIVTTLLDRIHARSTEDQEGLVVTATSEDSLRYYPTLNVEFSFDNQNFRTFAMMTVAAVNTQIHVLTTWDTSEGSPEGMRKMHQAALSLIQIKEP